MVFRRGLAATAAAVVVAGNAWLGNAECAFRLGGWVLRTQGRAGAVRG